MTRRTLVLLAFGLLTLRADDDKSVKLEGVVRYYKPGEWIGITIRPQVEQTYNLASKDTTYVLDPDLQVGSKVEMEEGKDPAKGKMIWIRIRK